jgi:hypothetical protein
MNALTPANSGHRPARRQAARWALCAALALIVSGGHWGILQSVAWTRMLVVYARTAPLETALEQTFDGQHPCCLCRMIQEAKHASAPTELRQPIVRDNTLFADSYAIPFGAPPWSRLAPSAAPAPSSRREPPPVPPPRFV